MWAQLVFNCQAPDAGNGEILHMFGTDEQKERFLQAARRGHGALVLLDDRARGLRCRSDGAAHDGRARRRRVGDQRAQVVLVGGRRRHVRDRHGRDRPRRAAAPADEPDHRPGRDARVRADPGDPGHGARRAGLVDPLRGALHGRARAARQRARRAGRRLPDRAEAARPGADPPRHALARADAACVRADVPLRARARGRWRPARGQADGAELDRRLRCGDPGLPAAHARRGRASSTRAARRASRSR